MTEEVALLSRALWEVFRPDKLNVATLGNLVPQLHVHVIARFRSDAAWPDPVWGKTDARPYAEAALRNMRARIADWLGGSLLPAH